MKVTGAVDIGDRHHNEDRHVIVGLGDGSTLLAVFDGHGGSDVSELASQLLPKIWEEKMDLFSMPKLMEVVFAALDEATAMYDCGSTASIVWIHPNQSIAVVGVLGDSPVIVYNAERTISISPEHNVRTNEVEAQAVRARGGFVQGGYALRSFSGPGLQMSRALGDKELDRILSRDPEIYPVTLGPDSFILVGSDGIFDPRHDKPLLEIINKYKEAIERGEGADGVMNIARSSKLEDNATVIVYERRELRTF